jgi:hypothetical protein
MPWRIALLAPLVVAIAALAGFLPFLTREREVVVATPQPPPLFQPAPITLLLGAEVCPGPLRIDGGADVVRVVGERFSEGDATVLHVAVSGPGYAAARTYRDYAPGQALDVALPRPPRPLAAKLCVANYGDRAGLVQGNGEGRGQGALTTTLNGRPSPVSLVVTLLRERRQSVLARLGETFRHAAALQPGFAPAGVLWVLAVLVLLGVPAAVTVALRRAPSGVEARVGEPQGGQVEGDQRAEQQRDDRAL